MKTFNSLWELVGSVTKIMTASERTKLNGIFQFPVGISRFGDRKWFYGKKEDEVLTFNSLWELVGSVTGKTVCPVAPQDFCAFNSLWELVGSVTC